MLNSGLTFLPAVSEACQFFNTIGFHVIDDGADIIGRTLVANSCSIND